MGDFIQRNLSGSKKIPRNLTLSIGNHSENWWKSLLSQGCLVMMDVIFIENVTVTVIVTVTLTVTFNVTVFNIVSIWGILCSLPVTHNQVYTNIYTDGSQSNSFTPWNLLYTCTRLHYSVLPLLTLSVCTRQGGKCLMVTGYKRPNYFKRQQKINKYDEKVTIFLAPIC